MNPKWQSFLSTRKRFKGNDHDQASAAPQDCVMALIPLRQFSCLQVTGEDAATFLQGQTTCDVRKAHNNSAELGAILNPKGRVLSTFWIIPHERGYWLLLPESLAQPIEKKLRMYILRSRVVIENIGDSVAIFGLYCESLPDRLRLGQAKPSHGGLEVIDADGSHILNIAKNQWLFAGSAQGAAQQWNDFANIDGFVEVDEESWNLISIQNGIATLGPETTETFVPQMLNLDALGGISFEKGCYTGQEIVARMHYLGKLKRRMALATTRCDQLPAPGDPVYIYENEQSVGQVVNAAYVHEHEILLLAVIQIESIESNSLHLFNPNASTLKMLELPYSLPEYVAS